RTDPPGPPLQSEASATIIARADEVVERIFRSAGCPPTKIEGPLQWNEDPHDYDQWAIHLNRHHDWLNLGRAYAETGDDVYAREFVALLNSWIDAMPVNIGPGYVQGPYIVPGRVPLTLDAGIRMAQTWWPAYYHFRNSPEFDTQSQFRMLRSFVEHADYLMEDEYFRVDSNWGAMEANGLFHIAAMLPEMRESRLWLDTARERLTAVLDAQVYPDGAQIELAPGYHGVTLGNLLGSLELARRTGTDLPDELEAGLESMFEYYARIAMPDSRSPALNDSSWGGVDGWLQRGLDLFPDRADFAYVMSDGTRGTPPDYVSTFLPWAGWAIMRTGWAPDDRYLLMEAGPYGRAHQHEDKLGIILHAAGKTVLTEAGVYSYDRSDWRKYVLSTRAHNTIMVDGLEQNRRAARDTWISDEPVDARWFSDDDFDFARGVYDSGYGPENEVRVAHERQVLFVKPDYWIVCDTLTPEDDAEHAYEALFHLDAETAEVDAATGAVTVEIGDAAFRILPVGAIKPEVEIVSGQTEPAVQGWLPAGGHGNLRPIPTAVFRWQAAGPSTVAFLLLPREAGEDWPVTAAYPIEARNAFALQADRPEDSRDVFVSGGAGTTVVPGVCETDGDAAMVRLNADGSPTSTFSSGASRLEVR
ncbi:MAG: alginate lyase family protein, partial [Armatimonadota bacterium]